MMQDNPIASLPRSFIDDEGRITGWPARKRRRDQLAILTYLLTAFHAGQTYSEREVNDILNARHTFRDPALLRRELVDLGWIGRTSDGSSYGRIAGVEDGA
jgi:hypothetical protein